MKILVYGGGSLGSLLGAAVSRDNEVCLLARPAHAEAVKSAGLVVEGMFEGVYNIGTATNIGAVPWKPDLLLLTAKAYDTRASCEDIARHTSSCPVVTFQNGLGNLEIMQDILGEQRSFGATTTMGAMLKSPGHLFCAGRGNTRIQTRENEALESLTASLARNGFPAAKEDDIMTPIWQKAVVNIIINYLAALAGRENGWLVQVWDDVSGFARELAKETCHAAEAEGIILYPETCLLLARDVAVDTAANRCSMLRALDHGKRTENEALAGAVLRLGRHHGLDMPRTESVYTLMKLREGNR